MAEDKDLEQRNIGVQAVNAWLSTRKGNILVVGVAFIGLILAVLAALAYSAYEERNTPFSAEWNDRLKAAAGRGDVAECASMISHVSAEHNRREAATIALFPAVQAKREALVLELLKYGADADHLDFLQYPNPVVLAATTGDVSMLDLLLSHCKYQPMCSDPYIEYKDEGGKTKPVNLLTLVITNDKLSSDQKEMIVRVLTRHGAFASVSADGKGGGLSGLEAAITMGDLGMVKLLISLDTPLKRPPGSPENHLSPIVLALSLCKDDIARYLWDSSDEGRRGEVTDMFAWYRYRKQLQAHCAPK